MFLGRYEHTLDEKGRLTIPVRFRESLQGGAFVTQGFERNLMVLVPAHFSIISEHVNQMSLTDQNARQLRRLIFSSAEQVELDKTGRILIPTFLREAAGLGANVIIAGAGEYFEIWAPEIWKPQNDLLQDVDANVQRFSALDLPLR